MKICCALGENLREDPAPIRYIVVVNPGAFLSKITAIYTQSITMGENLGPMPAIDTQVDYDPLTHLWLRLVLRPDEGLEEEYISARVEMLSGSAPYMWL